MSGSFATSRPAGGIDEVERRRRAGPAAGEALADPLAELARLVGQNDPFRGAPPQIRPTLGPSERVEPSLGLPPARRGALPDFDDDFRGALDAGEEPGAPDDPAVVHPALETPAAPVAERFRLPTRAPRAPDVSPDTWARGPAPAAPVPPGLSATREEPMTANGSSKRTLIVLAAVVALTGGGLAASFLAKPSSTAMVAASPTTAAPTILAATGPSKVQPETPAADPNGQSAPSTLLDKNQNDGTATAKVVNTVEQPVDLNQAVKPAAAPDNTDETASSPFPEPRKVKTILVRPDGSIITDASGTSAKGLGQGSTADQQADLAFDPKTSLPPLPNQVPVADTSATPPPAAPAAAAPATATPAPVKAQARVAVTPKAPGVAADGGAATQGRAAGATPKIKPVAAAKPVVKPPAAEVADAAPPADAPASTASLASGKFAAQLGAGASEAEARDLTTRLSRKFADAVGGRLSVHKAQSGDKTVFRVRVSGLSQDAAKAVCAKVTGGGGGCFVARD